MIRTLPYKTKQFFVVLIKLSIVVGAFYFVYHKLTSNEALDLNDFVAFLHQNELFSTKNIIFLIFLTLFNWFFEILKWKYLVSSIGSISFKSALEQSLGALTASLLTPNRIGEYGVKAMYYPAAFRKKIMFLNLIQNTMQMTTTILFGLIGLLFFINYYSLELDFINMLIFILTILFVFVALIYMLKTNRLKIKGFLFMKILDFIKHISTEIKLKTFAFSVARYLIFSFQFYFLLQLFDVNITYLSSMMVITTMYLLSSIIPSIFILDVVIKGSVAVFLFSMLGINELTILCIVTLMWLLNFVIPIAFGSYYVLNFNLPKVKNTL